MSQQRFKHFVAALALVGGLASLQAAYSPVLALSASLPVATRLAVAAHPVAKSGQSRQPGAAIHQTTTGSRLGREVFGFALASSLSDATVGYPSWNFSALSTVAFFGLHINWDGTIIADSGWSVWSSSALTNLLTAAHGNGTKVVLTIVLQDFQPGTPNMCAGLIHRATTVSQTVAQVVAKHVDGVNIDYEGLNGTCQNGQTPRAMFTDFAHRLRSALPSGSYVSVDTYASSAADSLGFFDVPSLNRYVDSFFVMAYDLEYSNYLRAPPGCTRFCLGPTAPVAGYYYNDTTTASQYSKAVGAAKVILGVPYYGRKACVGGVAPNAYPISTVTAESYLSASGEITDPAVAAGSYTAHRDSNDPAGRERWDTWFNTTLKCTRELYWDDVTSLGAKYDLVNRDGLRGVGIWNLNYGGGAPELWSALFNHFSGCPRVAVTSSPASTAPVGTSVSLAATASNCANPTPRFAFWLQTPGSTTWQLVQQYSTTSTFNWNTAGKPTGTYRFSVWALDAGSNGVFGNSLGRWDSYVATQYVLTPTQCGSVSVAFSPSAAVVGAPVTITGTVVGCPNPRYEFWTLAPGATTWRLGQAYSTASTFIWKTGAPAGVYHFSVWARDASSTGIASNSLGSWDTYAAAQYTLIPPCSSVGVSTLPASAAPVGSSVAITGAAVGCPSPLYQFWMLPPGSASWQLVQAYAGAAYSWNTTGLAAGVYQFSIWARDSHGSGTSGNSLGRWDAYKAVQYTLFTPCTGVSVVFSPPTSAKAGTVITITAAASGCRPLYAFWILSPGSSKWLLAQAYSSKATLSWSTTGEPRGTYQFSIWARDSSSPGVVGDSVGRWDAYKSSSYVLS
jgi:spore germination protein YaaH